MFEQLLAGVPPARPGARPRGLHVCVSCGSSLVQLEDHTDAGDGHWHLLLRCPECEHRARRTVPDALCCAFDDVLEDGTIVLLDGLSRLLHERTSDGIDAFALALRDGLLLPEDF